MNYQIPGVYYERVDTSTPAIEPIRMDVAGFVGIALRGPIDKPVPVQSWRQFQTFFGGFTDSAYLAYAVKAFFENGGRRCWVVRVASQNPLGGTVASSTLLKSPCDNDIWRISAYSPGVWGNNLSILIKETNRAQTVTVTPNQDPNYSLVSTTSGFERATFVRLLQETGSSVFKVISKVDHIEKRLYWVHPMPEKRLPYDSALTGFNADLPIFVESVEYTLLIKESGRLLAQYENLSLVPQHPQYGPTMLSPISVPQRLEADGRIASAPNPIVIKDLREDDLLQNPSLISEIIFTGTTSLTNVVNPTLIHLGTNVGMGFGTSFELLDPLNDNQVIGEPLTIEMINPPSNNAIILAGNGLSSTQLTVEAAANAVGKKLGVRLSSGDLRTRSFQGGADGLTLLRASDFIGEEVSPLDNDKVKRQKRRGIRALELVDEIGIVAVPDIHIQPLPVHEKPQSEPEILESCLPGEPTPAATPVGSFIATERPPVFSVDDIYRVQAAAVQHCEKRRDRIALLDPPFSVSQEDELGIGALRAWRSRFDSKYTVFYYPWLKVVNPFSSISSAITRAIPPSGFVAGQYAKTDFEIGVHKAPANAPLVWVQDVTSLVNEEVHGILNPLGINVIRSLPGRGIRILGGRTVSS